jgi:predicted Rossmann-fold nucleotide-binding protein
MFEAITLIQKKNSSIPYIILVGTTYWSGLIDWIKAVDRTRKNRGS